MISLNARHFATGQWVEVVIEGALVASVKPVDGPEVIGPLDDWLASAFWDIQVNGRWGISFSSPDLTVDQVVTIVRAQATLGTARVCPTLITSSQGSMLHGVRTIAQACEAFPDVDAMVLGIHLEGPAISERDGYRGAHPLEAVRNPSLLEFEELFEVSRGRIALITLAPERPGAIEFLREVVKRGVVVGLGHTAADGQTIDQAVEAGATLSTHLGNGIASPIARHPNPIWDQASDDRLWTSLIADGHHLGPGILKALVRAKTPRRIILVSDASPLAGLPPGRYGEWEVDPSGKIVVAGTDYLAGSNRGIEVGINNLVRDAGLTLEQAIATATVNPAAFFDQGQAVIAAGRPANLIRYRRTGPGLKLRSTCVDGIWVEASW